MNIRITLLALMDQFLFLGGANPRSERVNPPSLGQLSDEASLVFDAEAVDY